MAERRSSRSRKIKNYAKFVEDEDTDDDDFREAKTPPEKRARVTHDKTKNAKTEEKQSRLSQNSDKTIPKTLTQMKRPSVEEKVFQRQMNMVLELSKVEVTEYLKQNESASRQEKDCINSSAESIKNTVEDTGECTSEESVEEDDFKNSTGKIQKSSRVTWNKGAKESRHSLVKVNDISKNSSEEIIKAEDQKIRELLKQKVPPRQVEMIVKFSKSKDNTDFNKSVILNCHESPAPNEISGVPLLKDDNNESYVSAREDEENSFSTTKTGSVEMPPCKELKHKIQTPLSVKKHEDHYTKPAIIGKISKISAINSSNKFSPIMLPSKFIRVGLSRKISIKPLHVGVKLS